jgi:predicted nucleic acid-binding protein
MIILFDTNVLLDIALAREPFSSASLEAWSRVSVSGEKPLLAPHSLATFDYIVRQVHGRAVAKTAVKDVLATGKVALFDDTCARDAQELAFSDFEDAMVAATAQAAQADLILTRNKKDFKHSPVPCKTPEEFLKTL